MTVRELELHIRGMTSAACVNLIESVLNSESGVRKVSVNLVMDRGVIIYENESVKGEALLDIVRELGYGVEMISEKEG